MVGKEQIVEELGELLLPNLLNKALVANDRAKYLMTLLQTAREHAARPDSGFTNLHSERMACGIEQVEFDAVVEHTTREAVGLYRVPELRRVREQLMDNLQSMLAPIQACDKLQSTGNGTATELGRRLEALAAATPSFEDDLISAATIDQITSAQPVDGDSIHLLVMQMHKELNRLQQQISAESIEGAHVYGIEEADRNWIAAFMRGVNRTRRLKFGHVGLDTTATRTQGKLVIQNDIGTTDAHVLVIHVSFPHVTVTYTDVHIQRLIFFQNLLKSFHVVWDDTRSRRSARLMESLYHACVGRFTADEPGQLASYLEHLGSRLVFLIDWNRARKRLRKLAPKRVCLEVLQWAADHHLGHMAFLNVGGEQLVFDALQWSSRPALSLGGQLSDIIGSERAAEFLKFTLKTAAEGLLAGHSELLIRDEVRAELRHYLDTAHQGLVELAAEHATLIVELATAARDCLLRPGNGEDAEFVTRMAARAKKWEHRADELVTKARTPWAEQVESKAIAELLRIADDAADDLEEGLFLLTLLYQPATSHAPAPGDQASEVLQELANLVVRSAQEYLKAVENARYISRGSLREEMGDFLKAVDSTISLEHQSDDVHRRAMASILGFGGDGKQLYLFTEIADNLESASDAMMRAALTLKDYVLSEVITR